MLAKEPHPFANLLGEIEQLQSRVAALVVLQDIAREVTAELNLNRLLHKILSAAVTVMNCSAGSLLLYDPLTAELVFEVVEGGGGQALEKTRIRVDQGIAGAVFTHGEPILLQDAGRDERHLSQVPDIFGIKVKGLIAVPLIAQGQKLGVLELMNKISGVPFDDQDRDLLLAFASQSAIAIENARLIQRLRQERDHRAAVEVDVRRQVSRELHDGPAQLLSAIVVDARLLPEVIERAPDRVGFELAELRTLSEKALHQVRNILFFLRPLILEKEGLGPALSYYAERMRPLERFDLTLDVVSLKTRFDPEVESSIFAIVQEAVSNAKRHALPHHVWIQGGEKEGQLVLTVRDDGCGFDPAQAERAAAERNSFGLLNMRERAELARATLVIESEPGRGTRITLRVPLPGSEKEKG